jgi:RNA polymerase sigma-70 factor, ECF subfamily
LLAVRPAAALSYARSGALRAAYPRETDECGKSTQLIDIAQLRQTLVRVVARICPAWLSAQRDDVVQAAVMRVVQVLDKLKPIGEGDPPFSSSYLHKVAHSALVDEIRRARRRRETDLEESGVAVAAVAVDDPERQAAGREIGRGIQSCLLRMKRERRLAVTLYLQGHNVADAARILEWNVKRTENLTYRGLVDLRACLKSKGMEP